MTLFRPSNSDHQGSIQVLVVDGSAEEQALIQTFLSEAKDHTFDIAGVFSLDDALVYMGRSVPDVIILSLALPDSRGLDTLRLVVERVPHVPIVAITSQENRSLGPRALQVGAEDYLIKSQTNQAELERSVVYSMARKWNEVTLLQAEQAATLGILARGLAHQFNNINQTICGYTELLLRDSPLSSSQQRKLNRVLRSAREGAALSQKMLRLASPDPGVRQPGNVVEVVREVLHLIEPEFVAHGMEVEIRLDPVPDSLIDVLGMSQALLNILINSLQAMVDAPKRRLAVSTSATDEEIVVEISDTGSGISTTDLTRLFCPFFGRKGEFAGDSAQQVFRGPGLGLCVSYSIVRHQGGQIHVKSREGAGTTFQIALPRKTG